MRRPLALPLLLAGAPLAAQQPPGAYGHLPYADAGPGALVPAPDGFALGQPCRLRPGAAAALGRLLAAFAASGTPGRLRGVSCYRSGGHQRSVFCRDGRRCADAARRAHTVAPPGYSEHGTGYAIDFAARPQPGCADTSDCFAGTPAGRWLTANGPRFGFEQSFPTGNRQGVAWEPWHWRWVGVDGEATDARPARAAFSDARMRYPAFPLVPPLVVTVLAQPPVPLTAIDPPAPPPVVRLPKEKRRRR